MSKAFDKIAAGLQAALAHANGVDTGAVVHTVLVGDINVSEVRKKTKLDQATFARVFGMSVGTLRGWEQKRRKPDGPARVLLTLIDRDPAMVLTTLRGGKRKPAKGTRLARRRAA